MSKKGGASVARLELLHELLVEQILWEFTFYKTEKIPMSATDKQVALSLLRQEGITAVPDNEQIQELRDVASKIKDDAKRDVALGIIAETAEACDLTAYLN